MSFSPETYAVIKGSVGQAGGIASLDSGGKVPASQLPSYVDDVVEYASVSAFPETGEAGKIYVAIDTGYSYRWGGTEYVLIGLTDYTALTNKPQINGVTLEGDLSTSDLGIEAAPMVETTYAALKALRDGGNLVPGMQYRITDYETIITGSYDLSVLGASGYLHNAGVPDSHPFDLIVVADDESHLNENARAALHSGDTYFANSNIGAWKLKYSLDNDTTKFAWANSGGKGIIFWMEDEWNNRAGFDFKNIKFLRYALKLADAQTDYTPTDTGLVCNASTQPNRYGGMYQIFMALQAYMQAGQYVNPYSMNTDGSMKPRWDYDFAVGGNILGAIQFPAPDATYLAAFGADWYYTFDYWDATEGTHIDLSLNSLAKCPCRENYIEMEFDGVAALMLGVFNLYGLGGSVWEENSVFTATLASTAWNSCSENHLGVSCYFNTFGNSCSSNTFGNSCYSNTFGNSCYSNTFGNSCDSNTFGNSCDSNTFGNYCDSNTFGNYCDSNTFGNYCSSNTFGNYCYSNTFGNYCSSNTFGNYCSSNTFGNYDNNNNFVGNMLCLHCGDHVVGISASTTQYGISSYTVKTLENYDGASGYATLIVKTGYNTETAVSTTDGGTTWA